MDQGKRLDVSESMLITSNLIACSGDRSKVGQNYEKPMGVVGSEGGAGVTDSVHRELHALVVDFIFVNIILKNVLAYSLV